MGVSTGSKPAIRRRDGSRLKRTLDSIVEAALADRPGRDLVVDRLIEVLKFCSWRRSASEPRPPRGARRSASRVVGVPPMQYLIEWRMALAKAMLQGDAPPLEAVRPRSAISRPAPLAPPFAERSAAHPVTSLAPHRADRQPAVRCCKWRSSATTAFTKVCPRAWTAQGSTQRRASETAVLRDHKRAFEIAEIQCQIRHGRGALLNTLR
jgi:hypothetical protein